jgi:hypothetical protein
VSEYTVIRAVSDTLQTLLQQHMDLHYTGVDVQLGSPPDVGAATDTKLISLWLYRVGRNEFTNNEPPIRPTPNQVSKPPLLINLHYLVTPVQRSPETRQELLGLVMQTFNDHSIVQGSDLGTPPPAGLKDLRVVPEMLSLEELARVWDALQEAYMLSVSYVVQVVAIDSGHEPLRTAPVLERDAQYEQVLGVS